VRFTKNNNGLISAYLSLFLKKELLNELPSLTTPEGKRGGNE
jgi:hypothetical protein